MGVRIGFIGCGGIANNHMRYLAQNPDAELVAFSDEALERARAAAKEHGGRAFKSAGSMLRKADLEAVFICIPPVAHGKQVRLAIEAGCAVFTEKPIGLNQRRVDANVELIASAGVVTSVGYNWRYTDGAQMARRTLDGKKLALVSGSWIGGAPGVMWWRQMAGSGGQAVEQTTHIFDLARYIGGEIETVFASGVRGLISDEEMPHYDVHDASVVQLRYAGGAVGNITSACIASQGGPVELNVFARDMSVTVGGGGIRIKRVGAEEFHADAGDPTSAEQQAFLAAVQGKPGPPILSPYEDAARTLRVTLAANRSMETGRPVSV